MSLGLWFYFWGGDATAQGETLTAALSLIPGTASGDAQANGQTLVVAASLISGTATGDAVAAGQTLTVTSSLLQGQASGDAVANGAILAASLSLIEGTAQGDGAVPGRVLGVGRAKQRLHYRLRWNPGALHAGSMIGRFEFRPHEEPLHVLAAWTYGRTELRSVLAAPRIDKSRVHARRNQQVLDIVEAALRAEQDMIERYLEDA